MLPERLIRFRRATIIAIHLALVPVGYLAAFGLRFDFSVPNQYETLFWSTLPFLLVIRLLSFGLFKLYQGWWRHVGMHDLLDLIKAVSLSSALFLATLFMVEGFPRIPRSVLILDWGMAVFLFGGIRFAVRGVREGHVTFWRASAGRRTLIVGAGESAEWLLRQVRRHNGNPEISPICLVDDDPAKHGTHIHSVPVVGGTKDLDRLVIQYDIGLLIIAIPSATREQMQTVVQRCLGTGIEFKIVPSVLELMDGRARLTELRKVQIEDLLGRDAIDLDLRLLQTDLSGKVVLVTGGAGSIGSELARQIAGCRPKQLILLEQAESPLYFTHLEISKAHPDLKVVPVVADITDQGRLEKIFSDFRPDYVFHAAAYKHVPLMETNVVEAVRNNVLGTLYVAQCAEYYGADKFVLISTDKAVNPSSVMGATKRIAERIVLGWPSFRRGRTDFRAVRFGNVLGSDGSVVPLFRRQLAAGEPLTVTHPEMTRYFMTIPEAAQLVLQAAALPEAAGRISMLEMGEPVRILDLAENLIRLSGLEPYRDVPIVFTGMRPGEKLHEELMSCAEASVATKVDKIRVVRTDESDAGMQSALDRLAAAAATGDQVDLLAEMCALVPECTPPLRESGLLALGMRR